MTGWRLFWLLAALQSAAFAAAIGALGTDEPGLRALVRVTARVSFLFFLPVYLASPLRRLAPAPTTRWLLRQRRYLGVAFAWAHGLHATAIVMLALVEGDAFDTDPILEIFGSITYALIFAMALTSSDRAARWLGPERWKRLHRSGLHAAWLLFAVLWTGGAPSSRVHLVFALAAWGAAGIRLAALARRRARAAAPAGT